MDENGGKKKGEDSFLPWSGKALDMRGTPWGYRIGGGRVTIQPKSG